MKLSHVFAGASLVVASLGFSVAADAQVGPDGARTRVVTTTTRTVHTRTANRHGNRWHRPRCTTKWRHHRKIRVCR